MGPGRPQEPLTTDFHTVSAVTPSVQQALEERRSRASADRPRGSKSKESRGDSSGDSVQAVAASAVSELMNSTG